MTFKWTTLSIFHSRVRDFHEVTERRDEEYTEVFNARRRNTINQLGTINKGRNLGKNILHSSSMHKKVEHYDL
jgi:hypothetical protein